MRSAYCALRVLYVMMFNCRIGIEADFVRMHNLTNDLVEIYRVRLVIGTLQFRVDSESHTLPRFLIVVCRWSAQA